MKLTRRYLIVPLLLLALTMPACSAFQPPATHTTAEAAEAARRVEIVNTANVIESAGKLLEDLQLLEISLTKLSTPTGAKLIPDDLHVQIQRGFKVTAQAFLAGLQTLRTATTTTDPIAIVNGLLPHLEGLAKSFGQVNPIAGGTLTAAVGMIQSLLKTRVLTQEAI